MTAFEDSSMPGKHELHHRSIHETSHLRIAVVRPSPSNGQAPHSFPGDIVERSARFVLRRHWWVIGFWLVALVAGGWAAGQVPNKLSYDFSLPGQEGSETAVRLAQSYGVAAHVAYIPVLTAPGGGKIADRRSDVTAVADKIRALPGLQVLDYGSTGNPKFLTDDGRSTFVLVYAPRLKGLTDSLAAQFDAAVAAAAQQQGLVVRVTGYQRLSAGSTTGSGPRGYFIGMDFRAAYAPGCAPWKNPRAPRTSEKCPTRKRAHTTTLPGQGPVNAAATTCAAPRSCSSGSG